MPRRPPRILPAVACLAVSAGLLAACGGTDETAARFLRETFRSGAVTALHDGYLSLSVRLVPRPSGAADGPVTFTLLGPFRSPRGADELGRFDVELATMLGDRASVAHVRSTGTAVRVTHADGRHDVAETLVARLRQRSQARDRSGLPVIGLDPARWIRDAQVRRRERAVGVETIRLGGTLAVERLLADVAGLLADAAGTRSAGSRVAAALLSPRRRSAAADAATFSVIDIWTGASDRLVRQISARVDLSLHRVARLPTATAVTLEVHVRLDDVNEHASRLAAG